LFFSLIQSFIDAGQALSEGKLLIDVSYPWPLWRIILSYFGWRFCDCTFTSFTWFHPTCKSVLLFSFLEYCICVSRYFSAVGSVFVYASIDLHLIQSIPC
jgi:hypothetical protein